MVRTSEDERKAIKALFSNLKQAALQPFPKRPKDLSAPTLLGVYMIYDLKGQKALHVGSTPKAKGGIKQRLRNHMQHKTGERAYSSFVKYYPPLDGDGSRLWRDKYTFRYLVVDCRRQRALLEAYAAGHLCPAHIGGGSGHWLRNPSP